MSLAFEATLGFLPHRGRVSAMSEVASYETVSSLLATQETISSFPHSLFPISHSSFNSHPQTPPSHKEKVNQVKFLGPAHTFVTV